jgi:hypothetical protein
MNKNFYAIVFAIICLPFVSITTTNAQGCVAVRNMSSCSLTGDSTSHDKNVLQISLNYRYFKSFRHYKGREEQLERLEKGTEVINHDNSVILGATYSFNKYLSAAVSIPFLYIDRSSMYEHLGNNSGQRFWTTSQGLGDVRLSGYVNPIPNYTKGSLVIGLGVKLPTGDYSSTDEFHKMNDDDQVELQTLPVDQSIQPGDGGTGIVVEYAFSHKIIGRFHGYTTGFYMSQPRNTNGTRRSQNLTANIPLSNEFSVVDQYMLRGGFQYVHRGLQVGLGLRYEGIPAEDLIGDSDGFRRPGYIISYEPSVFYSTGKHTFGLNLPIVRLPKELGSADIGARNRTQSHIDKQRTEITGQYAHGDAAFADWLVSLTYAYKIAW